MGVILVLRLLLTKIGDGDPWGVKSFDFVGFQSAENQRRFESSSREKRKAGKKGRGGRRSLLNQINEKDFDSTREKKGTRDAAKISVYWAKSTRKASISPWIVGEPQQSMVFAVDSWEKRSEEDERDFHREPGLTLTTLKSYHVTTRGNKNAVKKSLN